MCRVFVCLILCFAASNAATTVRLPLNRACPSLPTTRILSSVSGGHALNLRGGGELVKALATKAEFDALIKGSGDKLIVVDFTATWCGPCQKIAPIVEKLAAKQPNVIFVKVDVDANEETSAACDVTCMPTFQFYKNGQKLDSFEGADEKMLTELVQKHA